MSANNPTDGALEHCESMAQSHPDLADSFYRPIASFYEQKLWHQFTVKVLEFVADPRTVRTTSDGLHSYLALYDKVVLTVDSKLHQLSLARIAAAVSVALSEDREAAKNVLETMLAKEKELDMQTVIYLRSKLSLHILKTTSSDDQVALTSILSTLRESASALNEIVMDSADEAFVQAAYYDQSMSYYKLVGPPESFYKQAMSFLTYAPMASKISAVNYDQLGIDLCLAALTGDGIYNLGELVDQPVVTKLKQGDDAWLVSMLQACVEGDVVQFMALVESNKTKIDSQPTLSHRAAAVKEKLWLLALVKMAFEKEAHERILGFEEIAAVLKVEVDQVEMITMRALSVGLIKGFIDQIDKTVKVTWVLPRSLNSAQLQSLAARYGEWSANVANTRDHMQEQTSVFA